MKKLLFIVFLFLSTFDMRAQDRHAMELLAAEIDTLADNDTLKVRLLNQLAWDVSYLDLDSGLVIINRSMALARAQEFTSGEAEALNVAGTIYADMGRYTEAVDAHLRAIRLREKTEKDPGKMGESYHNLALVYLSMDSLRTAMQYNQLAYNYYRRSTDSSGIGPICNYLAEAYLEMDSLEKAQQNFREGMIAAKAYDYKHWIASNAGGLAYCNALTGNYESAHALMTEAFEVARQENNEYNMMAAWVYWAKIYRAEKNYPAAIAAADSALAISTKLAVSDSRMLHLLLKAELHELNGDAALALSHYRQFQKLKSDVLSSKNQQNIRNLEAVYEKEQTEQQLEILREDGRLQTIYAAGGIVISAGFVVIAFLLFGRIRMGKKAGQLLVERKAIIESKNKDITDSINYARRIQDAVTPVESQLAAIFPDSFVFNRPRSIVTGDFWWMAETSDRYFVVAGDCSGHGVPGGFMSVMAASFLNGIIIEQQIHSPEAILAELNKKIRAALQHSGTNDNAPLVSDTIEIAICSFNKSLTEVAFSSAGMPVTLVRKHQMTEYRGSAFRAGAVEADEHSFTLNTVQLQKEDQLFLFSDGLLSLPGMDQKNLQDLLESLDAKGTKAEKALEDFVKARCGKLEQPDDVLVIGVKI